MDAGDVRSGEAFALRVQQILLWIALTDASDIEKARSVLRAAAVHADGGDFRQPQTASSAIAYVLTVS